MPPMTRKYQRPKNAKKTLKEVLRITIGEHRVLCIFALICILCATVSNIAGSYFIRPLINDYIVPLKGVANPDYHDFIQGILTIMAIYIIGIFGSFGVNYIMMIVTQDSLYKLRIKLFKHMQKLPISYFDKHTHGELMSRFTNDVDAMRQMIAQSLPQLILSSITIIGVFTMMCVLSWALTLLVLVMVVVMVITVKELGKRSAKYFIAQQKELGVVNGYIEEMMAGQKVVKVFCHEPKVKDEFDVLNDRLCHASTSANTYANILFPVMGGLSYVNYAFTAVMGTLMSMLGWLSMDLGTLASFLQYSRNFSNPITQISQQINSILMALAGAERVFATIEEPEEVDDGYVTLVNAEYDEQNQLVETVDRTGIWAWKHPHSDGTTTLTQLKGDVRFYDVDFSYVEGKQVLNDVSLFARPGEKIAFVGSTGAGKTTITNLINRFYDIQDGKIRYDGININKIKKADLRHSLAMVLQDTHLFTGTVKDNIRYGRLDATDEEIVEASKLANAHYFISHLPQGYDTLLTADGANLSQGQRQLIAIARAAVANPPVLILDEATSSIDTRTEMLIEKGMDKLMEGRTVFVIAHRLSTVRNANAIMVLENGEIIERGDHDDLLDQKGKYYQLYTGTYELS